MMTCSMNLQIGAIKSLIRSGDKMVNKFVYTNKVSRDFIRGLGIRDRVHPRQTEQGFDFFMNLNVYADATPGIQ